MKKSLLVSSLLLAAAGCAAEQQGDLADVQDEALKARADLVDQVFVSKDTFTTTQYRWDAATKTSTAVQLQVKLRVKFLRATDYELDDKPKGMDYEVVVEQFVEATGETFGSDSAYFARRTGKTKHEIYDCDSTRKCHSDFGRAAMYIYDAGKGAKGLKLQQDDDFSLVDSKKSELEFVSVHK